LQENSSLHCAHIAGYVIDEGQFIEGPRLLKPVAPLDRAQTEEKHRPNNQKDRTQRPEREQQAFPGGQGFENLHNRGRNRKARRVPPAFPLPLRPANFFPGLVSGVS